MDLGLAGRGFLVTGGTKGLGFASAKALIDEGARVLVSSRSEQGVMDAVAALGAGAAGLVADNADPSAAERLVEHTVADFGSLDGLLVSVGGPPKLPFSETSDDQWRAAFESVTLGTVRLIRAATPAMTNGGAIALVLSSSVRTPIPGLSLSNVLRPGLAMMVKQLADELGPDGIRVLALVPGRILTERTITTDGDDPDARRRSEATIPLRRLGTPEEFGRVAAFVLSPAASYMSGSTVTIDGGMVRGI
jgi:3-oxoacyl-[acyl-carrier protein] reductase